jgi:hypothetical protein
MIYLLFIGDGYRSGAGAAMASRLVDATTAVLYDAHYLPDLTSYLPATNRQFNPFRTGILRAHVVSSKPFGDEQATEDGVKDYIRDRIRDRTFPYPQGDVVLAILPQGQDAEASGEHGTACWPADEPVDCKTMIYWGFVRNNGVFDDVTDTLSHEIVEAASNPAQSAIFGQADACEERSGHENCEIADACPHTYSRIAGIRVAGYWLDPKQKCAFGDQTDPASR